MKNKKNQQGFTLIEILVVIGLIAVLAAIVIIAINPARQFAQGRDSQRNSDLNAILNATGQRVADNKGLFNCGTLPTATSTLTNDSSVSPRFDIRSCLVPTYISELPVDPTDGTTWNGTTYNTKYQMVQDSNGRLHVIAPNTEPNIPRTASIEIVR